MLCIRLIAALTCLTGLLVSCGSTTNSSEGFQGPSQVNLETNQPGAAKVPGWMNIRTLQIHPATTKPEADDLTLDGILVGWIFEPKGSLKGALSQPEQNNDLEECWLSLRDRKLFLRSANKLPSGPYLVGRYDRESELFYPTQSAIMQGVPRLKLSDVTTDELEVEAMGRDSSLSESS